MHKKSGISSSIRTKQEDQNVRQECTADFSTISTCEQTLCGVVRPTKVDGIWNRKDVVLNRTALNVY